MKYEIMSYAYRCVYENVVRPLTVEMVVTYKWQ